MKSHVQVAVIGGGVVGCSVLYHLTKAGWRDVVLIERSELTSGSTWHAAGGFHTLNSDPNVAKLQAYTVGLYKEIEEISGQSCGLHLTGGLQLADTPERLDWLKMAHARGRYLGMETEIISAAEAKKLLPLIDESYFVGAHVGSDRGPSRSLRHDARLCEIGAHRRRRDLPAQPRDRARPNADGSWNVVTEQGTLRAEHVVNAGGLWAREIGRMVGHRAAGARHGAPLHPDRGHAGGRRDQPSTGKEIVHAIDFAGEIYTRQERGRACCSAPTRRRPTPWSPKVTPWDFGQDLLTPDLDRIAPSLEVGFKHFPALQHTGIRKIVNGPFTFSPDGNPLVGPVRGLKNFWCACAVMAGFSQGGGVGLALSNWMVDGDPGFDVWGMDVARFGAVGDARLHQRQGARELFAPLPHPLPERGAAGRAADADDAALRQDARAGRGDGRLAGGSRRRSGSRRRASSRRTSSPSTAPTISRT